MRCQDGRGPWWAGRKIGKHARWIGLRQSGFCHHWISSLLFHLLTILNGPPVDQIEHFSTARFPLFATRGDPTFDSPRLPQGALAPLLFRLTAYSKDSPLKHFHLWIVSTTTNLRSLTRQQNRNADPGVDFSARLIHLECHLQWLHRRSKIWSKPWVLHLFALLAPN